MVNPVAATTPISLDPQNDTVHAMNARTSHRQADHPAMAPAAQKPQESTVTISTVSQILALKQNGATADQIAARLHLSVAEVQAELGTSSATSSAQASVLAALSALH